MKLIPQNHLKRIIMAIVATVIIVWFYPHQNSCIYVYEEGRPWNYAQLIAPFDIPIHADSATVKAVRDTLNARFVPIYKLDESVVDSIINELPAERGTANKNKIAPILRKYYAEGVVEAATMTKILDGELPRIRVLEGNILSERSTSGLTSTRDIYLQLDSLITDPNVRRYFTGSNIQNILRPNITYNAADNKRYFDNEYQTLTADRGVILQGQAIINKGDIISAQDYTNLRTYEELLEARLTHTTRSDVLTRLGQFMYVALLMALLLGYCAIMAPEIYNNFRALGFVYMIVTIFFLMAVCLNSFIPGGIYLVPMALIPILMLVFFEGRTAMYVSMTAMLVIAPIATFVLEFTFLEFAAAAAAVYTLRGLSQRSELLKTAAIVALAYIVGYVALEMLMNGTLEGFAWRMPAFLAISALLTSMAYILMSLIERSFGFVSVVTLTELSDTNQPLLRELSDTCPGTFQHSMSVSNLACDAARAMGANELIVRVGALYHDIGKMTNPAFFTENQHGVNPHDTLTPEQSARIVINHVTDGLRRANKAGLPAVVKDFICQHHGCGKAKYFYYAYCNSHPDEANPDASAFTYPGPNPQSRETSLLMMADSVEAASRSLPDYSRESIAALVDKIIDGQIADGLHADSTLEFRDVPTIKAAFVKRLMTMYHTRVAYPPEAK
jgi:hypothetical protein